MSEMINKEQLLRDPEIQPTSEIIAEELGEAYKSHAIFTKELGRHSITLMDWRFYKDGKAWLSKVNISGRRHAGRIK